MDSVIFASLLVFFFFLWFSYTHFLGAQFYPTTRRKMQRMLEYANLKKSDIVYDLGCGDGRLVIAAAKRCREARGIEIDPLRFLLSWIKTKILGLKNAKIIFGDLFRQNLRDADVVFLFLWQTTNDRLRGKFEKELKKGTRIVSHYWIFHGWNPVKKDDKLRIYLYVVGESDKK